MRLRNIMVALALVAGASFHPADAQQLKSRVDSLNYSFGMVQSQGLMRFLDQFRQEVFGNDSTNTEGLNVELFMQGFNDGMVHKTDVMTVETANRVLPELINIVKAETTLRQYGYNKEAGEKFLAENAKKKGVKVLPSGVQYKILTKGTGPVPADTCRVKVHYEGHTIDGKEFDSSYKRGKPAEFGCKQVIKGWTEALTHMPVGSVWEVYIPQELAYGEHKQGNDILPFSMLIFKIELLEIVNK